MTLKATFHNLKRLVSRSFSWNEIRKMATMSSSGSDHLARTAANKRQEITTEGIVKDIENLSATVKKLTLHINDKQFSFMAGQWIDMFIPRVDTVGGFSMCSAPHLLSTAGEIHLAIKFSEHPPAFWVHRKCQVGSRVQLRTGGDFYYDPQPGSEDSDLLLVAGGVGINPLYSMLQHFVHLYPTHMDASGDKDTADGKHVTLLYSARNADELVFKDNLVKLSKSTDNVNLKLFSTREAVKTDSIINRRIQSQDVRSVLAKLNTGNTEVYICGPLPFIEAMQSYCVQSHVSQDKIHFEKWW